MADCIFCKIVAGVIPAFKVYEDSETLAFLDINPAAPGHTLVIPKKHAKDIFEIEEPSLRDVAATTKRIAERLRRALGADVSVLQNNGRAAGQAIEHLHVHVIPRHAGDRLPLAHMGPPATEEALAEMQRKIQAEPEQRVREALTEWDRL
ncbi:MAG: HIT family protein [Candidatus Aenigmatarchaeota archaeon]